MRLPRRLRGPVAPAQFVGIALASVAALGLVVTSGAFVRLTGSGLGCENWPRCGDTPFPAKDFHAMVEFGNRVVALVGIVAALVTWLASRRVEGLSKWVRRAALGAFLGHLFPIWLQFKGGKGIATYIGVLLGLFWPAAAMFGAIWIATAFTTRYSSLSALVACFVTPIFLWFFGHPALASLFAVMTLISFWTHRENIKRLQAGTEGKIGQK